MDLLFYVSIENLSEKTFAIYIQRSTYRMSEKLGITKSNFESSITRSIILLHVFPVYPQSLIIYRLVLLESTSLQVLMIASRGKFGYYC